MTRAIILAGGKGTRLAARLNGLPKPLVDIAGRPLLERQLELLRSFGIRDATILVNHKKEAIENFCMAKNNFNMRLELVDDGKPRGTAGAVLACLGQLPPESEELLILYGDTLLNVDLARFLESHRKSGADATLFLHPNDHPHDSDLVELGPDNLITAFHPYPHPENSNYANLVNAALYTVRRSALDKWRHAAGDGAMDFAKRLFPEMLKGGARLYGYASAEYIRDVGTPDRLDHALDDVRTGRLAAGSLATPRAAVFLDRDGVINREVGFLKRKDDLELLPGAALAIRSLNRAGLLCIVITNQPVLARGECTEDALRGIHARLDVLLGRHGAYLDRLYYCPHHPDRGFAGEIPELKIKCRCRKPETGLIERAARDFNIDFSRSWLVGDRTADILAGNRAGVRAILVKTGYGGSDAKYEAKAAHVALDLPEAAGIILDHFRHESA